MGKDHEEVFILSHWHAYDHIETLAAFRTQAAAVASAESRIRGRKPKWDKHDDSISCGIPGTQVVPGGDHMEGFSIDRLRIQ